MPVVEILSWLFAAVVLAAAYTVGYFVLATRRLAADAERTIPVSGQFITIGGNRLHYVEAGQGRPILFLHGLGGQLHHFRHTMFDRLAPDFRVIALDRPGSGYSVRAAGASGRLPEQASLIVDFVDALGLQKPLVVGHSLGGAVALALALDYPDKLCGLALLSPLSHLHESVPPEFKPLYIRSPMVRTVLSHTIAVPMALKYAPQTLDFVFGPQSAPDDYIIGGGGVLGLRPSHYNATVIDLTAIGHDLGRYEARYEDIAVPVGVLFGTADRVLDPQRHGVPLAARIKDFELDLLDGIGHMPQFVAPDRVESFIRRLAARSFAAPARLAAPSDEPAQ